MPPSECRESVGGATQQENRSSSKCAHHRTVSDCGNNLTTVIVQTVVGAKAGDYSFLTGLLNAERARKLRWNSNPGDVIELLVASLGLDYSPDGTKIMKRGHQQDVALHAQPLACPTSRKPALQGRATTISMLASLSLEHEADTCASGGSRAAQAAAEAARPPPLRSLTRVAPSASDKFTTRLGTGWGHHPRQRALRCIAEEHHARCGPITGMVESTDGAYWSCHQVGVVGAFRFVCAQGCCINWSSAERLPGAPAKTTVPHNMGTAQPMIAVSCSVDDNPTSSGERMQQEPPTAVNPKQLQEEFRRAVAHQERTRSLFSLASLWQEMELQTRAAVEVARRYLARESEHPKDASVIEAVHAWVGKNRAPLTQTRGAGLRPADYKVNLDVYSDALLCGVSPPRLREWVSLMGLGEATEWAEEQVKASLEKVLLAMDSQETEWVVQMVILAGDLSVAYDGFHSQNRNAQKGMGNFTSRMWGLVLMLEIMDKHQTKGIAGVAQRLEKEGLKIGTTKLVVDCGLPIRDICTDQCSGAPRDLALVLQKPNVQYMLRFAPMRIRAWVASHLGGEVPPGVEATSTHRWRAVVEDLHTAFAALANVELGDLILIAHHYDVYHVEVKVNDGFKVHVERSTKTTRALPDRLPGAKFPHPKFEKKVANTGVTDAAVIKEARRKLEAFQNNIAQAGSGKSKQHLNLNEIRALIRDAGSGFEGKTGKDELLAILAKLPLRELPKELVVEGGGLDHVCQMPEPADVGKEGGESDELGADEMSAGEGLADLGAGGKAVAEAEAELVAAVGEAKKKEAAELVRLEALRQEVRTSNREKLVAREELLGAEAGLLDTIRHHFYRVAQTAAARKGTLAERQAEARKYWRNGLLGHVYFQDHSHCCDDADCVIQPPGYKQPQKLSRLAGNIFKTYITSAKMDSLIDKDCESLANLEHMYQPKRIVFKRYQTIPMIVGKLDKNENTFSRFVRKYCELRTRTGARRIAQKSTAYLVPTMSSKTFEFRKEAKGRFFQAHVDRHAPVPITKWPPLFAPAAILRPISRPAANQLPPSKPRTRAAPEHDVNIQADQEEQAMQAQPPAADSSSPSNLQHPMHFAKIVGPNVGEPGSVVSVVLQYQGRDWCCAPHRTTHDEQNTETKKMDELQLAAKLEGKLLISQVITCPCCNQELSVQLPSGITTVQCMVCKATDLHVVVRPPEEKPMKGRSRATHHGPARKPALQGRPPTAWNLFFKSEGEKARIEAAARGQHITSQESMRIASMHWKASNNEQNDHLGNRFTCTSSRKKQRTPPLTRPVGEPIAPGSREKHVRARNAQHKSSESTPRCAINGCPLMKSRIPPPENWTDPLASPICDECKEELTDKYSWKCVMRCDYDCCEHCYVRGLDAVVPS